jgi:hypothetical protein
VRAWVEIRHSFHMQNVDLRYIVDRQMKLIDHLEYISPWRVKMDKNLKRWLLHIFIQSFIYLTYFSNESFSLVVYTVNAKFHAMLSIYKRNILFKTYSLRRWVITRNRDLVEMKNVKKKSCLVFKNKKNLVKLLVLYSFWLDLLCAICYH